MGQVSRHSAVFFAGTMFTAAAGYFFKVYLARVLGADALGIYALGMTIVGFLAIFNGLGMSQAAVRFVAAYSATGKLDSLRGFLPRVLSLLLISNAALGALVLWAGPWIAVRFYHTPALVSYLGLFVAIMVLGVLTTFCGQVLGGYKDIARRTLISTFAATSLTILFTLALIQAGMGLRGYIVAQVASAAVVLVLLLVSVRKLTPPAARSLQLPWPPLEREVFSFSAAVFGMDLLVFLIGQADKILIGFYLNPHQVGIYSVAAALVAFVPVVLQSVNQIFSPTIAHLHARGEREVLGQMFQTLTKWILGFTLPLAAVMILFARPLMQIFGPEFEAGWPILIIGTTGQLINCAVGSVGYLLLMSGKQRTLMKIQIVMAAATVLLNVLFIPRFGILGAAAAGAITTILTNVWSLVSVRAGLGLFPYNRSYVRLLLPGVASIAIAIGVKVALHGLTRPWIPIVVALLLAYCVFVGIAALAGLDDNDRTIARAAWERLRSMALPSTSDSAAL